MSLTDYLLDRLALLLGFVGGVLLLMLVVHLGVARLSLANATYILLLGTVTAGALLLVDYRRQQGFRLAVRRALDQADEGAFEVITLPRAKTREQRALAKLLSRSQSQALNNLQGHRRSAEHHRAFVDLWVHQMKTPLAVLELTVHKEGDTEAWRSVAEEVGNLGQGLELMLTSARLERFDLDLTPSRVDLVLLARASVNELKSSWIQHGIFPSVIAIAEQVGSRKSDEPGPSTGSSAALGAEAQVIAETDPKWLTVVLRQLLTNAIKYGHAGDKVRLTVRSLPGGGALVSVEDEGPGIPEADVPRIFERFYTGVNGRRTQASTGMGLYLAAEICRRLGHDLTVETAVGEGATFTVTIRPKGLHRLTDT